MALEINGLKRTTKKNETGRALAGARPDELRLPLPRLALEERRMEGFPLFLPFLRVRLPPKSQSPGRKLIARRERIVPTHESVHPVGKMTVAPVATPVPRLHARSGNDRHELTTARTERPAQDPFPGQPRVLEEVTNETLGPANGMTEVNRPIAFRDQNPSLIDIPRLPFFPKPGCPDPHRETVGRKDKTRFPALPQARRLKIQPDEILPKFDPSDGTETQRLKLTFQELKVFRARQYFRRHKPPPFIYRYDKLPISL